MTTSRYAVWMAIELRSGYHASGFCEGLQLRATAETVTLLQGLRLRTKQSGGVLLIIGAVDELGRPAVPVGAAVRLRFLLEVAEPGVLAAHNVDLDGIRGHCYHLSNLADNAVAASPAPDVLHLSRSAAPYESAQAYVPGALVTQGGRTYECLAPSTGNSPTAPDSAFWLDRGSAAFVSNRDLVALRSPVSRYSLSAPARTFVGRVFAFDPSTGNYDAEVYGTQWSLPAGETEQEAQLDLSHLRPARYRVVINGETFDVYLDAAARAGNALGIVELYHHLPVVDPYAPLTPAGEVRGVRYTVAFANRYAHWRYQAPLGQLEDVVWGAGLPAPATPPFQPEPGTTGFITRRPLGMLEASDRNRFDLVVGGELRPAPRPDPARVSALSFSYDEASRTWRQPTFTVRLSL